MLLYEILPYAIKKSYKNNTFRISALTWNDKFELPYSPNTPFVKEYAIYNLL